MLRAARGVGPSVGRDPVPLMTCLPRPEHRGVLTGRASWRAHETSECRSGCVIHDHTECCDLRAMARLVCARRLRRWNAQWKNLAALFFSHSGIL